MKQHTPPHLSAARIITRITIMMIQFVAAATAAATLLVLFSMLFVALHRM